MRRRARRRENRRENCRELTGTRQECNNLVENFPSKSLGILSGTSICENDFPDAPYVGQRKTAGDKVETRNFGMWKMGSVERSQNH